MNVTLIIYLPEKEEVCAAKRFFYLYSRHTKRESFRVICPNMGEVRARTNPDLASDQFHWSVLSVSYQEKDSPSLTHQFFFWHDNDKDRKRHISAAHASDGSDKQERNS